MANNQVDKKTEKIKKAADKKSQKVAKKKYEAKFALEPVISEKSYALANAQNKYTFLLPRGYSKLQVAHEVEKQFGVKVVKVNSITRPGKGRVDWKVRRMFRREDQKKIIVKLKDGDKIDQFFGS